MASLIYLDTHVVIWLYMGQTELLSARARTLIDAHDLAISPMVVLELSLLGEIGRLNPSPRTIVDYLRDRAGLRACDAPFAQVIEQANALTWTRDPFDRIIVAQAAVRDADLVTRDRVIRDHYDRARWDE